MKGADSSFTFFFRGVPSIRDLQVKIGNALFAIAVKEVVFLEVLTSPNWIKMEVAIATLNITSYERNST